MARYLMSGDSMDLENSSDGPGSSQMQSDRVTSEPATVRYRGILAVHDYGDADDVLFLDGGEQDAPLAEVISDDMEEHGRYLSVRYWTADAPGEDDVIIEGAIREMLGESDATYVSHYSERTGYLWTDEEINVGGHDLLEELKSHVGLYCLLEISYSRTGAQGAARDAKVSSSPPAAG